jgi:hypothetical protein
MREGDHSGDLDICDKMTLKKEIVQMSQYGGRCGVDYSGPG